MTTDQVTIASAVIVPELPDSPPISPSVVKRRQSSVSESTSKRARIEPESLDGAATNGDERNNGRKKNGQAEEKKRGQRLFGALLGTLSQSSPTNAQRRRADIEKKQQAKLKIQEEAFSEKQKTDLEELMRVRRREQKKYDEQSMRIRHSNLLATANFLRTTSEPYLYYKPWELLPNEEARIKKQVEEATATVDREAEAYRIKRKEEEAESNVQGPSVIVDNATTAPADDSHIVHPEDDASEGHPGRPKRSEDEIKSADRSDTPSRSEPNRTGVTNVTEDGHGDGVGDGGEVILEAGEDTVIY
ncbi:MAG: hypothetical protein M1825_002042 [Sarcosagium campestre]|nr:MAG: hypothetical protein M1825_002042 [Sarcosagium campestre]